jgi:hypothetical protein
MKKLIEYKLPFENYVVACIKFIKLHHLKLGMFCFGLLLSFLKFIGFNVLHATNVQLGILTLSGIFASLFFNIIFSIMLSINFCRWYNNEKIVTFAEDVEDELVSDNVNGKLDAFTDYVNDITETY